MISKIIYKFLVIIAFVLIVIGGIIYSVRGGDTMLDVDGKRQCASLDKYASATESNDLYVCQYLMEERQDKQYQAKLVKLGQYLNLTTVQQQQLKQLATEATSFFYFLAETESVANIAPCVYPRKTRPYCDAELRFATYQSYENMRQKMLIDIKIFKNKKATLPNFTSIEFKQSDIVLNQIYSQVIHELKRIAAQNAKKPNDSNCYLPKQKVTSDTIIKIQEIQWHWLRYRAAWLSFSAALYPQVSADSWNTWLNQERTMQLKTYLNLLQQRSC